MLEVLVALLIFAIGALGYAGLQLRSLGNAADANYRAYAAMVAQDAVERIRANPSQTDYYRTLANWAPVPLASDWSRCTNDPCAPDEMAQVDIRQLKWTARTTIPGGDIAVRSCGFSSLDCVVVGWDGQNVAECVGAAGVKADVESRCFVMEIVQ